MRVHQEQVQSVIQVLPYTFLMKYQKIDTAVTC